MSATWYTAAELAALKLASLPATDRAIQLRAKREEWQGRKRAARGGGMEYPVAALPPEAQDELRKRAISTRSKALVAQAAATAVAQIDPAGLKAYQRDSWQARMAILAHIDSLVMDGASQSKAINALVAMAKAGELPPELAALVPLANARSGIKRADAKGGRTLSRSSLYDWLKEREKGATALVPAAPAEQPIPEWAGPLMDLYARPSKPSLAWAVEELGRKLRADLVPSYDQARRFLLKLDSISRNAGRMGPRALKSYRAYVARDTAELWPTAVYVADGHCFDAEVQHPRHGRAFRPEITTVVDVYTRRIVGWALGLSENKWDVSAAAVKAFTTCGVCDIWYADNGPGFNNHLWDDHLTGLVARLSITKKNSLPYNSQARGVIERLHQTVWVRAAKTLTTYMGAAMDGEARQRAFKRTRKDIAVAGQSRALLEWPDFVEFCERLVDAYNNSAHTSLPKTRDPETGRKRHMTPNEMWADAMANGCRLMPLSRPTLAELVREKEADYDSRLPGADARLPASNLNVMARVDAGGEHGLYGYIDYKHRQTLPMVDHAEAEYLEDWAGVWGIRRLPPTFAYRLAEFTGNDGQPVPEGTELQRGDGAYYVTTAAGVIAGGKARIEVRAVEPWAAGTLAEGVKLRLTGTVAGVNGTAVVVADGGLDGTDAESDVSLLSRLLTRIAAALEDMLRREGEPGGTILISHIRAVISGALGEKDHTLVAPLANVAHAANEFPVLQVVWS